MKDDSVYSDNGRLKELAREAYDVMARMMANYHWFESLVLLKRFIRAMRRRPGPAFRFYGQTMGYHVFPFFIDLILRYGTALVPTRVLDDSFIAWLIDKYVGFPGREQLPSCRADLNRYVPEILIRMAFEQLTLQENTRSLVPRMLFFYKDIPDTSQSRHHRFIGARDEVLKRQFKVHLDEVLLCTFVLGAVSNTADRFKLPIKTEVNWLKPYLESDAFEIVLSQLTLSREEYSALAASRKRDSFIYVRTEPQLIYTYPIIRADEFFIAPDPHLLLNRVTKNLHDSVYQYFIDNDKLHDYSGSFGHVYKDYIGVLLRSCFGDKNVLDLDGFDGLKGQKADWIVFNGTDAGIFECKAQRYPQELRRTGSLQLLDSFVNDRIGPPVGQLSQTREDWKTIRESYPSARSVRRLFSFIVFEEHFHLANMISDFLPENSVISGMNAQDVYIISTLDLETIASSNYAGNFTETFIGWTKRLRDFPALHQHVQNLPSFEFTDDNLLENKFNEFFHKDNDPPD